MAPRKPPTAAHYTPKDVALVRRACLTLATYLGSFLDDLVVVGGLVPTLLIGTDDKRDVRVRHRHPRSVAHRGPDGRQVPGVVYPVRRGARHWEAPTNDHGRSLLERAREARHRL